MRNQLMMFATYAGDETALYWILLMVESLRQFGGRLGNTPVWCYLGDGHPDLRGKIGRKRIPEGITFKRACVPLDAKPFPFAGKVFASALAENEAVGKYPLLVWLDPDVVFVQEPAAFFLPDSISFGFRPVMHKLIGSRFSEPLDEFWLRVYEILEVLPSAVFPVRTPVDGETLRAYFNAGLLVVRPEMGVLRKWPECFAALYSDPVVAGWCAKEELRNIFLHQAALAGDVLTTLRRTDTVELPPTYNYSLLLKDKYPPHGRPVTLDDVVLFRHEFMLADPEALERVRDSSAIFKWVSERLQETD
jgi:hypothetical protein